MKKLILTTIVLLGITGVVGAQYYSTRADETLSEEEEEWLMAPTIVIEGTNARIEGPDADLVNSVYANDTKLRVSKGNASFADIEDEEITFKATLSNGVVLIRKYRQQ